MAKKLTPKQRNFVNEYLVDLNASKAAARAGYKPKWAGTNADKLLKNTNVASAIDLALEERANRTRITADNVVRGLLEEAQYRGEGASHAARVSAWSWLGKHLGMFRDKVEHEPGDQLQRFMKLIRPTTGLPIEIYKQSQQPELPAPFPRGEDLLVDQET